MKELIKNIHHLYGEQGTQWLLNLPRLVLQIAETYGLSDLKPVKNLSYNYVLSGFKGLKPVILKLGFDRRGLNQEASALKAFAGFGVVTVLAESDGMLLLERAIPGVSLQSYFPAKESDAIPILCGSLKRLHQAPIPSDHPLPHIKDWLKTLDEKWDIQALYLQEARDLRDYLLSTSESEVLLHGDLHHDNILQQDKEWLVIDPKGVIGEPAYEVAAFIRNPIPLLLREKDAVSIIHSRINGIAEILELPQDRIIDWCFVQAVLAWVWALEDGNPDPYFKGITMIFYKIKFT